MLKYVEISYKLKNGKTRTTIAEKGFVLEKLKSDITKEMIRVGEGYSDPLEMEMMIEKAVEDNSFDNLPLYIKNKYEIKDYVCYYDFTEDRKAETKAFIKAKIQDIETFEDKEEWWEPKEITKYNSFYCKNLCSHSERCQYLQDYLEEEALYEEENITKEIDEELKKFI